MPRLSILRRHRAPVAAGDGHAAGNAARQLAAESGVRDGEEGLRAIFDSLNDGIIVHAIDTGAFLDVNLRLCAMFGYAREEMLRLRLADLSAEIPPYTMEDAVPLLQRARSGAPVLFEWLCRTREGRRLWIEVSLRRGRFGGRDVLLSAARDISQRKETERALRASETRYRDLFEHTLDAILTIDPSSAVYTSANQGTARLFGARDAAVFHGRRPSDYSPARQPDGRASVEKQQEMIATALRAGAHFFEWTHRRLDGTEFPADVLLTRVDHEGQTVIYATVRDVTERKRATEIIRLQADQYATMLATTVAGYWILDTQGRFIEVNDAYCRMTGYSREELLQLRITDIEANESPGEVARHMAAVIAGGSDHFESRHRRRDGTFIDIDASVAFWRKGGRLLVFARDISARKRAERELARSETRLRTVLDTAVDGIAAADVETKRLLFVNRSLCKLLGYSADELRTLGIADIHPADALPEVWRQFEKQLHGEARVIANLPVKRKDGSVFLADLSASPMTLDGRTLMVACFHDVTERNRAEEQLRRLARYDLLTGLANRHIFVEALSQAIARARRNGSSFAVLYMDLDHFKDVNDTLGHPVGDLLLQAVADRLRTVVREGDTVARFGGDEFAMLVADVGDPMDVAVIADRIREVLDNTLAVQRAAATAGATAESLLQAVNEPFTIEGNEIRSGTSIGIAVFGYDTADAETMLSNADLALYRAKSEARGTYRFFSPAMEADVRARVAMGTELRAAIAAEQLFLVYQPQVELSSGRIVGLEALVRWQHPTRGVVGPGDFIPEAERNGLIVPLGQWVLRQVCRQARKWLDAGVATPVVAVNLSGVQFKRPLDLERELAAVVAETGLPGGSLELELTESVLMEASRKHNDVLLRFRQAGYRLAIDDFGSGYSSLDYLRRFPVDRIKIAQSFIAEIGRASENDAIVKAALGLARELDIGVVVEGAESAAQIKLLRSWGCRIVQGFYFSRPLPVPEVTELLRVGRIAPPAGVGESTASAAAA